MVTMAHLAAPSTPSNMSGSHETAETDPDFHLHVFNLGVEASHEPSSDASVSICSAGSASECCVFSAFSEHETLS
jgi:hypothetical protein